MKEMSAKYNGICCVHCFMAQSLLGHLANVMPRMAKERKKKHLSGLSFVFMLDEQTRTVMCLENYVQTSRLINYINPQSCQNGENDLFVSIHGYTVA